MAEEMQVVETKGRGTGKRRIGHKKGKKSNNKRVKTMSHGNEKRVKIDRRMKKLFSKRARDYNSDDDENEDEEVEEQVEDRPPIKKGKFVDREDDIVEGDDDVGEDDDGVDGDEFSEDEDGEVQPGIMKFAEGCKAFKLAFKKITKRSGSDDVLGPVLSAHKKLIAEKLADEEAERKVKKEAKKEKHLVREKGHVKPANYLDTHEKFLIGIATKGVVKLFNAVNKAQHAQKGLNPSRSKDEKAIKKRRKEAFFSELSRTSQAVDSTAKVGASNDPIDSNGPAWAPLRDTYMLTNSKLKDWDKMQDSTIAEDNAMQSDTDTSSDDE